MANVTAAIMDRVDARRDEIVELAQRLVRIKSENPPGRETEVAEFLAQRLEALAPGRVELHARAPDRPNLLVRMPGHGAGPSFMLVGHTDTKPVGDRSQWTVDPFAAEVREGRLYGRGAADMKGAIAAMVVAVEVMKEVGFPGEIQLLFVADEEAGGAYGAKFMANDVGLEADGAVIGEPCGINAAFDGVYIAHRGIFCFTVKVLGTQMHSSMSDVRPSVNACVRMADVLQRFAREFKPTAPAHKLYPKGPTVNLAVMMEGGVFYGVCPGHAEFASEVRVYPGMTYEQLVADVEAFVDQLRREDPSLRIELDTHPRPNLRWMEGMELPEDEPVVEAMQAGAQEALGRAVPLAGFPGGTDARFLYEGAGIPTIAAFGPGMLEVCHGPDEWAPVEDIVTAAKAYALAAHRFLTRAGR